jgi:hypothetical protein
VIRKYLAILLCLSAQFVYTAQGQIQGDIFSYFKSYSKKGKIEIIQDPAIQSMMNLHLSQQVKLNGIRGYRISIYFGSGQESKKNAELTRANFVNKYENVKCYTKFEFPYFKVYVGDFRSRSEALKFLKQIEYNYPDAFVREDIIAFPE